MGLYWETRSLVHISEKQPFFFKDAFVTVPKLQVVSTSQLVLSRAWTTGSIHYTTDHRHTSAGPVYVNTYQLSKMPCPHILPPPTPVRTPTLQANVHGIILAETASTVCLTELHSLLRTKFISSVLSVSGPAVEPCPFIGRFLRRTTVSTVFSSVKTISEHYVLKARSLCVHKCNVAALFHTQYNAI